MTMTAGGMTEETDPGKFYIRDAMDELMGRIENISHALHQIKSYPLESTQPLASLEAGDLNKVRDGLMRIEKKAKLLLLDQRIMDMQNGIQQLQDERERVVGVRA
jgi:hypothetical protein